MTMTMAKELASRGVTCNAVAPGFISSDMTGAPARREGPGRGSHSLAASACLCTPASLSLSRASLSLSPLSLSLSLSLSFSLASLSRPALFRLSLTLSPHSLSRPPPPFSPLASRPPPRPLSFAAPKRPPAPTPPPPFPRAPPPDVLDEKIVSEVMKGIPAGRFGKPEEARGRVEIGPRSGRAGRPSPPPPRRSVGRRCSLRPAAPAFSLFVRACVRAAPLRGGVRPPCGAGGRARQVPRPRPGR